LAGGGDLRGWNLPIRGGAAGPLAQGLARPRRLRAAGCRAAGGEAGRAAAGDLREAPAASAGIRSPGAPGRALEVQGAVGGKEVEARWLAAHRGGAGPGRGGSPRIRSAARLDARGALPATMIEPVTLKGTSVILRPLSRDDVPEMRALAAGPRG